MAYYDYRFATIRHVNCQFNMPESNSRCEHCRKFRDNVLRSGLSRLLRKENEENDPTRADSHANFRSLCSSQKDERMKNLRNVIRCKDKQIHTLKSRLNSAVQSGGIKLDNATHNDFLAIMNHHKEKYPEGDERFVAIFWNQQLKAASLKNSKSIRWHPSIIRWCLYLHHRSSGAYSTLRNSGLIQLPSGRTLRDYRHCIPSVIGFSAQTDIDLLERVRELQPAHLARYVTVVLDEMYVKEGLVFDKASGSLIGYQDLGDVNNIIHDAETRFKSPGDSHRPLAKVMLVFMIRGLFTSLKYPYAQFPAASTKGADLFPLFRKVLSRLTRLGIRVMAVTCDGASDNRRLFSLHGKARSLTYKTVNVYSKANDVVYFISDPSHLIKTIRNCFQRGKLWVRILLILKV